MPPLSPSNRCFPARSFMDGSWTTCPSQFVQHKQRCATADCAIGQIECRPMPAAQIEVKKINHMAVQQPIDHIAKRAVFFFQAEDGIRDDLVTGVQTCALPI